MTASRFNLKNEPLMKNNLNRVGAGDDLSVEHHVRVLHQELAELLTALQKAGIKTEI